MALETSVKRGVRRVVQSLHDYARARGWKYAEHADWDRGDYYLDVVVNAEWLRIYTTFVAKAFEGQDGYARFRELDGYLRAKFADDTQLFRSVSLIVQSPREFDRDGWIPPGVSDERFDEEWVERDLSQGSPRSTQP